MTTHTTGTREDWLAARIDLLEAEKALTRQSDEVARRRQELPWVRVDKSTASTPSTAPLPWPTCSAAARSSWSTTSCSGRTGPPAARPAP